MSLYHVVGPRLVPQDEWRQQQPGVAAAELETGLEGVVLSVPGSMDIGPGKPLSMIFRHVYTGRFPKGSLFGGARKDVLLTSAVRDVFTTFNAAPRAVNMIKRRIAPKSGITGVDATENGTQLVFYSPAVTMVSTTATVEMSFDDYPDELVSRIGSAISTAGTIPLFGPYGPVMIGVGMAIKLASTVVNTLTDSRAEFSVTERLEFELPDGKAAKAGHLVLCEPSFDPTPFTFEVGKGLVTNGKPYDGDEPYVVLLLDGKKQDAFKDFTPTAATAALLGKFLNQKEGSEIVLGSIIDAIKVFNDVRFRREADRLSSDLDNLDPNSDEAKALKKKIDALVANISDQLLKPKA
jgi:hypothetical protein